MKTILSCTKLHFELVLIVGDHLTFVDYVLGHSCVFFLIST